MVSLQQLSLSQKLLNLALLLLVFQSLLQLELPQLVEKGLLLELFVHQLSLDLSSNQLSQSSLLH